MKITGKEEWLSPALSSRQQEHTCEKLDPSAATLLHQFQHEEETPSTKKALLIYTLVWHVHT